MSHQIQSKTKLLLPLAILILIVLLLSTSLISTQYIRGESLLKLENGIKLATAISEFVHSTQKERGLSSGYLANKGVKFKEQLQKQRLITDAKVEVLKKYIQMNDVEYVERAFQKAMKNIERLPLMRENVDALHVTLQENLALYSQMNDDFLNVIMEVSKTSKLPLITQNIIAYSNFLYAKENAGLERAVGTALLSQKEHNEALHVSFINLISIENLYTKTFLKYASDEAKESYKTNTKGECVEEVLRIREMILYPAKTLKQKATPEYWFENITKKINRLQNVDDFLEEEILEYITKELQTTEEFFSGYAALNLVSIAMFLLMIVVVVALMKNEKRLKSIVDKYIISSTTDLKGKITEVSDAFCDISGYTREELIGKPHNIIRHPDMPKSAFKELWDTIQAGKPWSGEVKNLKKDGGHYWVYVNIEPLFDRKDKIEGYAAIRLDITDSIHLEEELVLSQEKDKTLLHQSKLAQMGEMISMIAHQWRQPLTAISSSAGDLSMKVMLDNFEKEYFIQKLERIDNFSQHLSSTIDDFRNFYKTDKQKESLAYSEVVKGAFAIIATSLEYKRIKLISEFTCKTPIYVHANELKQVILNLIKNAEDALLEKKIENPYIKIRTYDEEKYSCCEISDNAGGIPQNIMQKIFEPYFSTKTQKDGIGLGLYMSKMIIEENCKGFLQIRNDAEGAVFDIKIPTQGESDV